MKNSSLKDVSRTNSSEKVFVVVDADGRELGLVTKFRDSRTSVNPWRAFAGVGEYGRVVGFFYENKRRAELAFCEEPLTFGGRDAAVKAVEDATRVRRA